jgi:hypothetical protein
MRGFEEIATLKLSGILLSTGRGTYLMCPFIETILFFCIISIDVIIVGRHYLSFSSLRSFGRMRRVKCFRRAAKPKA